MASISFFATTLLMSLAAFPTVMLLVLTSVATSVVLTAIEARSVARSLAVISPLSLSIGTLMPMLLVIAFATTSKNFALLG